MTQQTTVAPPPAAGPTHGPTHGPAARRPTSERLTFGEGAPRSTEWQHLARYQFAACHVASRDVLDVACGSGYGTLLLRDAGARRVTGVDFSQTAVDQARAAAGDLDRVEFRRGDAQDLSGLDDDSFDVVVSFETIEHLPDDRAYLREMARVLRPGGTYLVSTPDARLESTLFPVTGRPMNAHHVREYRRGEFLSLLGEFFAVESVHGQVYVHPLLVPWPVQVAVKAACRVGRRLGGARLKERLYDVGAGVEARPTPPGRGYLAKYLVAVCRPL